MRLRGKSAIVTGAGTGIGEAIAFKLAEEGASVMAAGLESDPVDDVVARIGQEGGDAIAFKGDLGEEKTAQDCVEAAVKAFGKLDILINNAGIFDTLSEVESYPVDRFDHLIRSNIRTVFLMTKFAIPHLQRSKGCIVSAGSEAGWNGTPKFTPYGGSKGFIHAFMKGVAVEQAPHGVRANCVCPGTIDTAWTHHETGAMDEKAEQTAVVATPLGRRGTPEEIANVYAFLASDEASFVTGALWLADGGITIAHGNVGSEVPAELAQEPQGTLPLRHSRDGNNNKDIKRVA